MANYILDNNQAVDLARVVDDLPADMTIVLPPLVWAECILARFADSPLGPLVDRVVFGRDFVDVEQELRNADLEAIGSISPLIPRGSETHDKLAFALLHGCGTDHMVNGAQGIKDLCNASQARTREKVERLAKAAKEKAAKEARWASIEDAWDAIGRGVVENSLGRTADNALLDAIRENDYLLHHFRSVLAFHGAYGEKWSNRKYNIQRTAIGSKDDFPDMMLALYAQRDDVVVTRDTKLRRLLELIGDGTGLRPLLASDLSDDLATSDS